MNHTENITRYTANFIDELVWSGIVHVVISPGSRSTPLAVLCKHHPDLKEWILTDERSAGYFALGIAQQTGQPAALICTSGSAAANYYPAIVEASLARVPLLILTADRPHELRGVGAPQAIDQIHMYGQFVKDFQEMALPEASSHMLQYVRHRAAKVVRIAQQENAGPVHVNFPFREPLMPDVMLTDLWGNSGKTPHMYMEGNKQLPQSTLEEFADVLSSRSNGLIVCGPQKDTNLAQAIVQLAEALGVPVLADPLSQLRTGKHDTSHVIVTYDALFREKAVRQALKPDYIVRFGAMPTSKSYRFFVEEHADMLQFVIEHGEEVREPTNHTSRYIFADSVKLCQDVLPLIDQTKKQTDWLNHWLELSTQVTSVLEEDKRKAELTEGDTVRTVYEKMPDKSSLFIGNSMPVRDLDTFMLTGDKRIRTFGNRGTSGIDGVVSSALGVAAVSRDPVTLMIGDLSFYHDLNGLLVAKQYHIPLTVILLNNQGGGIFSFLPQAKDETYFESLFGTPLDLDFEKVVTMYDGHFHHVNSKADLENVLREARNNNGLNVIEVKTDREKNAYWHRKLWKKIAEKVADIS